MINIRSATALLCWFVLISIGFKVNSNTLGYSVGELLLFILSSTTTNVGLLSIAAGLIADGPWVASVRRSFTVYVMFISGSVILFTTAVTEPTLEHYGKIAGSLSLICVVIGYRPELFDAMLDRATSMFHSRTIENSQ